MSAPRTEVDTCAARLEVQLAQVSHDVQAALGGHEPAFAELRVRWRPSKPCKRSRRARCGQFAEAARGRAADALQRLDDSARRQRVAENLSRPPAVCAMLEPLARRCAAEIEALLRKQRSLPVKRSHAGSDLREAVDDAHRLTGGEADRAGLVERWDGALAMRGEVADAAAAVVRAQQQKDEIEGGWTRWRRCWPEKSGLVLRRPSTGSSSLKKSTTGQASRAARAGGARETADRTGCCKRGVRRPRRIRCPRRFDAAEARTGGSMLAAQAENVRQTADQLENCVARARRSIRCRPVWLTRDRASGRC